MEPSSACYHTPSAATPCSHHSPRTVYHKCKTNGGRHSGDDFAGNKIHYSLTSLLFTHLHPPVFVSGCGRLNLWVSACLQLMPHTCFISLHDLVNSSRGIFMFDFSRYDSIGVAMKDFPSKRSRFYNPSYHIKPLYRHYDASQNLKAQSV